MGIRTSRSAAPHGTLARDVWIDGGIDARVRGRPVKASVVDALLRSAEPAVVWKVRTQVLGESESSPRIRKLREAVRECPRVRKLLARRGAKVYAKWQGAHWVLATLADLGYPRSDPALLPMRDQVCDAWLDPVFFTEFQVETKADAYKRDGVPVMQGRHRRCASQQGNALYSVARLGLIDERAEKLVERILHWRWPDGGWNCDKDPAASHSSFTETLLPMKGLFAYSEESGDRALRQKAVETAEVFLRRGLFRRESTGRQIRSEFMYLHYPLYWHYDFLAGLKAMAEMRLVQDGRCAEALDLLEARELPNGGWPAEKSYYTVSDTVALGHSDVDWGGTSKKRMNEWVTADALFVLRASNRFR